MVDGFYVNTYDDLSRDASFLDTLDRKMEGNSAGIAGIDITKISTNFKNDAELF